MKSNKIVFFALLGGLAMAGCTKDDEGLPTFIPAGKTDVGIYKEDAVLYEFNKGEHELYYNQASRTSRIQTENAGEYVEIQLMSSPAVNQRVKISLRTYGVSSVEGGSYDATVTELANDYCKLSIPAKSMGIIAYWPQ